MPNQVFQQCYFQILITGIAGDNYIAPNLGWAIGYFGAVMTSSKLRKTAKSQKNRDFSDFRQLYLESALKPAFSLNSKQDKHMK